VAAGFLLAAHARLLFRAATRVFLDLAALGIGALAGKPVFFLGAAARLDFGLLPLLGFTSTRFGKRLGASTLLFIRQRAKNNAAGALPRRRLGRRLRLSRCRRRGLSLRGAGRLGPAQIHLRARCNRRSRFIDAWRGQIGPLRRSAGDAGALLFDHHRLCPPARKALAHGVRVAPQ
jgi:hypothetical protein